MFLFKRGLYRSIGKGAGYSVVAIQGSGRIALIEPVCLAALRASWDMAVDPLTYLQACGLTLNPYALSPQP